MTPPRWRWVNPVPTLGKGRLFRVRVKVKGPLSEIAPPPVGGKPKSIRFNDLEGVLAVVQQESCGS